MKKIIHSLSVFVFALMFFSIIPSSVWGSGVEATIKGTVQAQGAKVEIYTDGTNFFTDTVVFRVDDGIGTPEVLTDEQKGRITTTVSNETADGYTLTINNAFPWLSGMKYFFIENEGENDIVLRDITIYKDGDIAQAHEVFAGDNHGMAYNLYANELHAGAVENGTNQYLTEGVTTIGVGEGNNKILAVLVPHLLGNAQQDKNYEFFVSMTWEEVDPDPTYAISFAVNPVETGSITGDAGDYKEGDVVTATATATPGYQFINWTIEGVEVSTEATFLYTVGTTSVTLTANFEAEEGVVIPDEDGNANATKEKPTVRITDPNKDVNIVVDEDTENPMIDFSELPREDDGSINTPSISIEANNAGVLVEIPAGNVSSDDPNWDGVINAPTVTTIELGEGREAGLVIEIGSSSQTLSFDKAVKISFIGEAGKRVGYEKNGVFTEITRSCGVNSSDWANANLPAGGDCKIDDGGNLIVWTKHFTKFATFTQREITTTTETRSRGGSIVLPTVTEEDKNQIQDVLDYVYEKIEYLRELIGRKEREEIVYAEIIDFTGVTQSTEGERVVYADTSLPREMIRGESSGFNGDEDNFEDEEIIWGVSEEEDFSEDESSEDSKKRGRFLELILVIIGLLGIAIIVFTIRTMKPKYTL